MPKPIVVTSNRPARNRRNDVHPAKVSLLKVRRSMRMTISACRHRLGAGRVLSHDDVIPLPSPPPGAPGHGPHHRWITSAPAVQVPQTPATGATPRSARCRDAAGTANQPGPPRKTRAGRGLSTSTRPAKCPQCLINIMGDQRNAVKRRCSFHERGQLRTAGRCGSRPSRLASGSSMQPGRTVRLPDALASATRCAMRLPESWCGQASVEAVEPNLAEHGIDPPTSRS